MAALIARLGMLLQVAFHFLLDGFAQKPLRSLAQGLFEHVLANAACLFLRLELDCFVVGLGHCGFRFCNLQSALPSGTLIHNFRSYLDASPVMHHPTFEPRFLSRLALPVWTVVTFIVAVTSTAYAISFAPPVTTSLNAINPAAVIIANLNGDSIFDVVTANAGSNDISVLLGNGDGTFQTEGNYPVGQGPGAIAVADLNKDTAGDLITANNAEHNIAVLPGNGDGTFQTALFFPFPSAISSIALGDFNGDGKIDLAAAGGGQLAVALGNGNCSFQAAQPIAAGSNPSSVRAADFNGDGKLDLVVANSGGMATIVLGNGDGSFALNATSSFSVASTATSITIGDFNNDEKPDLFFTFDAASTQAFVNNTGAGSSLVNFTQSSAPVAEPGAVAAASADLRNITNSDVVTANQSSSSISVLLSKADGTFETR